MQRGDLSWVVGSKQGYWRPLCSEGTGAADGQNIQTPKKVEKKATGPGNAGYDIQNKKDICLKDM